MEEVKPFIDKVLPHETRPGEHWRRRVIVGRVGVAVSGRKVPGGVQPLRRGFAGNNVERRARSSVGTPIVPSSHSNERSFGLTSAPRSRFKARHPPPTSTRCVHLSRSSRRLALRRAPTTDSSSRKGRSTMRPPGRSVFRRYLSSFIRQSKSVRRAGYRKL